jgi:hypothetical protein
LTKDGGGPGLIVAIVLILLNSGVLGGGGSGLLRHLQRQHLAKRFIRLLKIAVVPSYTAAQ